jgi:beta-lactam-binding protein with PASTA domain
MKSKLESLVAYLAGHEDDDAEWVRHELADPASEASQFLAATQELSRDAFADHVLKWLGLPANLVGEVPAITRRKMSPRATHLAVRVLPWLLSLAACFLAVLVWIDCRKHRHELEAALEAALAGRQEKAEAVEAPNERQNVDPVSQLQPKVDARTASMPASAPCEPKQGVVPDETKQPTTETKERIDAPTKAKGAEQEIIKRIDPPAEIPIKGKEGGSVITPDPSAPGRVQVPESRKPLVEFQRPENVAVPKIQGLSYAEAKKRVEAAGLVLRTTRNSETGLVKGQTPAAGSFVKRGEVVLVTLTPGPLPPPAAIQVPNVTGMTGAKKVEMLLKQAGLTFAAYRVVNGKRILIAPQNYNQLEKFKVVKQRPMSGASVPGGTCVECTFEAP